MIIALCILAYLIIGWIVASICLAISIRNNLKRAPQDCYTDFVVPFFFWWLVLIGFFIYYAIEAILWLGYKTEIFITKISKEKTND